ncbi:hypothetical protein C8Q70DRAFT_1104312 [Cubamyces menziesii]|nr:hypothetical protein C8Q70DRAFT_1104312 [Cubamyces menziesii]
MDDSPNVRSLLAEIDRVAWIKGKWAFERINADEDRMSDEAHREADKRVFSELRRYLPLSLEDTHHALCDIAKDAAPFEARKTISEEWDEVEDSRLGQLVCKLLDTLIAQGEQATFKEVRRFKIFQNRFHFDPTKLSAKALNERQASRTAWGTPFVGEYHQYLYKWIMDVKAGKTSSRSSGPYRNILPIIQSSGTGKSRLAHEVASLIFTLPLNFHGRLENKSSVYPEPDGSVAEYLTATSDRKLAKARHRWFLRRLVETAVEYLQAMAPDKTYKSFSELACAWRAYLSESGEATESRRAEMNKKCVANAPTMDNVPKEAEFEAYLKNGLQPLVDAIKSRVSTDMTAPRSWSSSHSTKQTDCQTSALVASGMVTMTDQHVTTSCSPRYKTLNRVTRTSLSHSQHTRASTFALLCIVVSTMGVVLRGRPIYRPGTMTLDDAATPEYMAKYGRPVFDARLQAVKEAGLQGSVAGIIDFAFTRLVGRTPEQYVEVSRAHKDPTADVNVLLLGVELAALGTRVLFDFDISRESARDVMHNLLSNHTLIAFSIPQHREYMWAGTPSEPILAHAAAKLMNEFGLDIVRSLTEGFKHGLLDKGQRGELVARLLLIFAHDKAQAPRRSLSDPAAATNWSQKVPVLTFLQALFAAGHHESIRNCFPANARHVDQPVTLDEAFDGAYVRFSHFVRLGRKDTVDTHAGAAALARGMAFQGYHSQPSWDVAIPVLMKDTTIDPSHVAFILIRVKARAATKQSLFVEPSEGMRAGHPCIVIEMHLGIRDNDDAEGNTMYTKRPSTGVKVSTRPAALELEGLRSARTDAPEDPRYEIKAYGCSSEIYGVIGSQQEHQYASLLATRSVSDEHARNAPEYLECVRRMKPVWERNKPCFDWADDVDLHRSLAGGQS